MELKQLTIQTLAKFLGKSPESVTELLFKKSDDGTGLTDELNEDAMAQLEAIHADHIKGTGAEALEAKYNEGHKAGKFEALSKAEDELRKQFGVEGKTLKDVTAAIAAKAAQEAGTEDKVLTHPAYMSLKTNSEAEREAIKAEYEAKLKAVEQQVAKRDAFNRHLAKIDAAILEAGAVMPKNPAAQATLRNLFLKQYDDYDLDEKETGVYLKGKDGALLKDKHGHPITIEQFTKEAVPSYFDIATQEQRQSPGNDPGQPGQPAKWTKETLPKSLDEFNAAYGKITDPKEQTAFAAAYMEANQA